MDKIKELFRHNTGLIVAVAVAIGLGMWLFGCQPQTKSPFNPDTKVTRTELDNEVAYYVQAAKTSYKDLETQELLRQQISEIGIVFAQGGTVDPVGAVVTLLGVVGLGAVADNRKKDSLIKSLQNTIKTNNETTV